MPTAADIRKTFLDYFATHGHRVVESSQLVPRNDPTLMFTNSGMVQFKNVFTGAEKRDYSRATTAQKCVRAGGKHNDLENVGLTTRHHTFFEMLGNFSFGDYFKDVAIERAWTLITKEYGLSIPRLMVTVYSEDDEAFGLWKKIAGLPDDRIIRISTFDNFWAMGDTGPCGPCSEIFFDHGDHIPGGPPGSPDADGDRFIEIWNLVFMQYEQVTKEKRVALPKPSIDTGMGLERITAALQGTHDNFRIDLLRSIIEASAHATSTDPDGPYSISHRVIADHIRASSFLIADGVLPSNEGRGYVLRRIMRRAMRHAHLIGAKDLLLYRLVPTLVENMGQAYPELIRAQPLITETLKLEEGRFRDMLGRGLRLLDDATQGMSKGGQLPGDVAFKLYDTYGFPLDLTQDALKPKGIGVDAAGFETAMAAARAEARKAWAGSGETATEAVWFEVRDKVGASEFLGYQTEIANGRIVALLVDGKPATEVKAGAEAALIVNQSPFYAESGGQQGDTGIIVGADGARAVVTDAQKKADDLIVHHVKVETGTFRVGSDVELRVDGERRSQLRANHSATHLLHAALRRRLGQHVTQKGSLVAPDRLRFDFSHPAPLNDADLAAVEAEVNAEIRANSDVSTRLMEPKAAMEAGAMALFGEKYGDEVRVVAMGRGADTVYSTELCGGTHVRRTGDIGVIRIVGESAVGAGVRRLEALTGEPAIDYLAGHDRMLAETASLLNAQPTDVPARVAQLIEDRRKLERELRDARQRLAVGGNGSGEAAGPKTVAGVPFAARLVNDVPAKELKSLADALKAQVKSGVVALASVAEGRASLVVGVTADLAGRVNAVELVKVGSEVVGGKGGGGRPDMAQAGGPDGAQAARALQAIEEALARSLQTEKAGA